MTLFEFLSAMAKKKIRSALDVLYVIRHNRTLYLGQNVSFQNKEYISFGENVVIGDSSKLLCTYTYHGENLPEKPRLVIGDNFHCTRNLTIQCAYKVEIRRNVLMSSDIFIIDYNHGMSPEAVNYLENKLELSSGVVIDEGAWIGNGVTILGSVTIGKKAIVGAGSVVTKDIPPYCIAAGNPAKVIKKYNTLSESWEKL